MTLHFLYFLFSSIRTNISLLSLCVLFPASCLSRKYFFLSWCCFFFYFDVLSTLLLVYSLLFKTFPFSYHCRPKGGTCQSFGPWRRRNLVCTPTLLLIPLKKKDTDLVSIPGWKIMMKYLYILNKNKVSGLLLWLVPLAEKLISHCSVILVVVVLVISLPSDSGSQFHKFYISQWDHCTAPLTDSSKTVNEMFSWHLLNPSLWTASAKLN